MSEGMIAGVIFLCGVIFTAGGIVYTSRKELAQTKLDVNRMGGKIREQEKLASRHHHNLSLVIMAMTEDRDERFKIAGLLRED